MNFYIGSGMKNCELVNYYAKELKRNDWNQTYNWVENINDDVSIESLSKPKFKFIPFTWISLISKSVTSDVIFISFSFPGNIV